MKWIKKHKFKTTMTIIFIILFIALSFGLKDIISVLRNNSANEVAILDTIKEYNYTLDENDSAYFKKEFKNLKKELASKKVDEKKYAELVSKLFVIDFFSLNSAINKNDVGGKQFVYIDYQDSFLKFAKDGIYKYVENNIYGERKQTLPSVKLVEIDEVKQDKVTFKNGVTDEEAYLVTLTITYDKDLEYQNKASLTLVHNDKKLEIAKMD